MGTPAAIFWAGLGQEMEMEMEKRKEEEMEKRTSALCKHGDSFSIEVPSVFDGLVGPPPDRGTETDTHTSNHKANGADKLTGRTEHTKAEQARRA